MPVTIEQRRSVAIDYEPRNNDSLQFDLKQGRGFIEFFWPELACNRSRMRPSKQKGATLLDRQYRCTSIHVDKGEPLRGSFYIHANGESSPSRSIGKRQMTAHQL